jgi:hypothetical protein
MLRDLVRVVFAAGFAALFLGAPAALAQTAPPMGAAQSFAVLGNTTVTNTGPSVVSGDVGVSPGTAVTGFPPGVVVGGNIHTTATSLAGPAQIAAASVYTNLAGQSCTVDLTGQDLGTLPPLTPGVYCFSAAAALTGTLTLNSGADPNAVFIFKIGSALTTASNSVVLLNGAGAPCNVFWQVTSSATLGTNTSFVGNIVALASITMNTGASLRGRALARNGAVTLDSNTVDASVCAITPPAGCPAISFAPATVPNGIVGVPYALTFTGSGGTGPYGFSVIAGALPPGLTLTGGGLLSGTPTVANPAYSFTIRAVDANGCFVTRPYTMAVLAAVPTLPQAFTLMLALALTAVGYFLLRQRSRAG